jgi:hypothetical protein
MKSLEKGGDTRHPSRYWLEEIENFDYMLDASPLVVAKLRRHTYHLTGIRAYDYRSHKALAQETLERNLSLLREAGGDQLLVPESPILGGFGFEIDGALYNTDTLKFYEALIALEQGGALAELRRTRERRVVCEIGPGWGGFPYQFKTLFPNVTYVLVDLPELFLFSAVYLAAAFPRATLRFYEEGDDPFATWEGADFVFVPNTAFATLEPPRVDLALNMVSFQEMTEAQVASYVARLAEHGAPILYSLNRERSLYNPEITSVTSVLERHYRLHEVSVLPVGYGDTLEAFEDKAAARGGVRDREKKRPAKAATPSSKKPQSEADRAAAERKAARRRLKEEGRYRHLIGWRRVVPEGAA